MDTIDPDVPISELSDRELVEELFLLLAGWSQTQVADFVEGVKQSQISRWASEIKRGGAIKVHTSTRGSLELAVTRARNKPAVSEFERGLRVATRKFLETAREVERLATSVAEVSGLRVDEAETAAKLRELERHHLDSATDPGHLPPTPDLESAG